MVLKFGQYGTKIRNARKISNCVTGGDTEDHLDRSCEKWSTA